MEKRGATQHRVGTLISLSGTPLEFLPDYDGGIECEEHERFNLVGLAMVQEFDFPAIHDPNFRCPPDF